MHQKSPSTALDAVDPRAVSDAPTHAAAHTPTYHARPGLRGPDRDLTSSAGSALTCAGFACIPLAFRSRHADANASNGRRFRPSRGPCRCADAENLVFHRGHRLALGHHDRRGMRMAATGAGCPDLLEPVSRAALIWVFNAPSPAGAPWQRQQWCPRSSRYSARWRWCRCRPVDLWLGPGRRRRARPYYLGGTVVLVLSPVGAQSLRPRLPAALASRALFTDILRGCSAPFPPSRYRTATALAAPLATESAAARNTRWCRYVGSWRVMVGTASARLRERRPARDLAAGYRACSR